jgi:hypothetical protein
MMPDDGDGDKENLGIDRRALRIRRNQVFHPCQSHQWRKPGTKVCNFRARIGHAARMTIMTRNEFIVRANIPHPRYRNERQEGESQDIRNGI